LRVALPHRQAQLDQLSQNVPLIIGALLLLLIIIVVLFWRMSRTRRGESPPLPPADSVKVRVPSPPPPAAAATLVFTAANGQHVSHPLTRPAMTIGRAADNDIVIDESWDAAATASKHHARLRRDQDDYLVRDMGSKNGTTVNGRQTLENLLQDGDRIGFGAVEAVFHQPDGGTA
jgi:hypothetical protein